MEIKDFYIEYLKTALYLLNVKDMWKEKKTYPAPGFVISLGRANPPASPWEMLCGVGASFRAKTGGNSTWSPVYALNPPSPSMLRPRSQLTRKR